MLTQENIDAINDFVRRWNDGERALTDCHPANERGFVAVLKALGCRVEGRRAPAREFAHEEIEAVKAMICDGYSASEISRRSGVPSDTVLRIARTAGLKVPRVSVRVAEATSKRLSTAWALLKAQNQQSTQS